MKTSGEPDLFDGPPPVTNSAKLDWIETYGSPAYLLRSAPETTLPNGARVRVFPPDDVMRREGQERYRIAFGEAASIKAKARLLKRYVSHFVHLAFDRDSWLWPLWNQWRARTDDDTKRLLRGLAAGISARSPAWVTRRQGHAAFVRQATGLYKLLLADVVIRDLFKRLRECRKLNRRNRQEYEHRYLWRLANRIAKLSGHRPNDDELLKDPRSVVLKRVASRLVGVRERDLH